jgi:predicted GTPase
MTLVQSLRRHWQEAVLTLVLALPWMALLMLGMVWLWQGGHVLAWALASALLGLLAWPLRLAVKRRADAEARLVLGRKAESSPGWNATEREAWAAVLAIADATTPLFFTETDEIGALLRSTVEAVARRIYPDASDPWAQFSLPDALLLSERLCRDIRREALRNIPGVRAMRLSHLLWVHRQTGRYGKLARLGWRLAYGLWRAARASLHPVQAVVQEAKDLFTDQTGAILSHRLRAYATRLLIIETGRVAIDLYSGRLALSDEEVRSARERDMAGAEADAAEPVRILLVGQVNAGKSSVLNAMARKVRGAIGPLPTTAGAKEYALNLEGRPAVVLVDTPGIGDLKDVSRQAARADLIVWVASATQPARGPDRKRLDQLRSQARAQLDRRSAPIILALTHVDQLHPAAEWDPPYNVTTSDCPKARSIRAAVNSVATALDLPADAVAPIAMPPERKPYNIDALWALVARQLDEARLAQLDRIRIGQQGVRMRELADQIGNAGRMIIRGIFEAPATKADRQP